MNVRGVDVETAAMSFAPDAQAPRLARRFVGDALTGRTDEGSVEVARLLADDGTIFVMMDDAYSDYVGLSLRAADRGDRGRPAARERAGDQRGRPRR